MSGGNGVDIAAVYQLLSQVAQTVLGHSRQLDDLTRDVHDLKRDVKVLGDGQATLRQTLTEYHSSVIGHGILISQLEDRVRRIEHHLNLPPAA
jgi:hypothetical protein